VFDITSLTATNVTDHHITTTKDQTVTTVEKLVSDWELVSTAKEEDTQALAELYSRHINGVFHYILSKTCDRDLAEDFTSETFIRAIRKLSTVTDQGKDFRAWLLTIARNIVLDHFKSSYHRCGHGPVKVWDSDGYGWDVGVPEQRSTENPETQVVDMLLRKELLVLLGTLTVEQREYIKLRFFAGMDIVDIAEAMGKTVSSVRSLQFRGVNSLRRRWDRDNVRELLYS
jgi:RNA polymerase sigma-70 factor, ECF subfamily